MGNKRVTVQSLKVTDVDMENNLLALKGAVPGTEDRYVVIRTSKKRGTARKWKVVETESKKEKPKEAEEAVAVEDKKADAVPVPAKTAKEAPAENAKPEGDSQKKS